MTAVAQPIANVGRALVVQLSWVMLTGAVSVGALYHSLEKKP